MAGAITAALFLRRFVTASRAYLHVDLYGWTPAAKPARPRGGAFQAARALFCSFWRNAIEPAPSPSRPGSSLRGPTSRRPC